MKRYKEHPREEEKNFGTRRSLTKEEEGILIFYNFQGEK